MKTNRKLMAVAPVGLLLLASPMFVNCSAINGALGAAGVESPDCADEFNAGDFGKTKADAQLKSFLDVSAQFNMKVNKVEADLAAACAELGKAIGVADADLKVETKGDGEGAKKVCGAVSAKIQSMLKANADASIVITVDAPNCGANLDVMTDCWSKCGSPIEPGQLEAHCEGGEISGECSGSCEGSCTADASASCTGTCSGSCEGKCSADFSGTCGGTCNGKCDGKDSKAKCAGRCEGSCDATAKGTCGGSCEGKCDASCTAKVKAECKGTCSGHCSGTVKAPKCSGKFTPPKVSIDCQAKCAIDAATHIECTPPALHVVAKGKVTTDLDKLVAALQKHLPKIAMIGKGTAESMSKASVSLVAKLKDLVSGAASLGIHTAGCVGFAADAIGSAGGKLSADVNVSVSISASASASGSAGTK